MNFGNVIYEDIEQNEYLNELYENLLFNYSIWLLKTDDEMKKVNLEDLLIFADILSKSNHPTNSEKHKVWGQEIASIAKCVYPNNSTVDCYLNSILSNNGNYRGLDLMRFDTFSDGFLGDVYNEYSKKLLEIPADSTKHFFKSQKRIYDHLEDGSFSFSGPTSMGKSFIMRMFIKEKLLLNSKNNFAIIVPSKALINEISSNLINELQSLLVEKNYRIVTSAGAIALEQNHNFIFILTPERLLYTLIRYENLSIDYVFIDEAHKISEKDSRSAFYYKVVDMLLQRANKSKIFFSSPNIPNPQVFLKILSNNDNNNSLSSNYSPVSQLKYLLDYSTDSHYVFNDKTSKFIQIHNTTSFGSLLKQQFDNKISTIVYVNSKDKALKMAKEFASIVDFEPSEELKAFSKEIASSIHEDFYLAELILKGVAFHIGYLPSNIRQKLESLYKDREIRIMFCTSTLVEGVNLPADNLFITTYKRGQKNLSPVDFKNLIGRVGRIEYNLYGHVFLTKLKTSNVSINTYKKLIEEPVPEQNLSIVTELSFEDKKLIVDNLLNGIIEIPKGNIKPEKYKLIRKFELILLRDIMKDRKSVVKSYFSDILNKEDEKRIRILFEKDEAKPDDDINVSVDQTNLLVAKIKEGLHYPNLDYNGSANYNDVLNFLQTLSSIFKWNKYEDELSNPMVLSWYATLLCQWIEGKGLQHLTNSAIQNAKGRMHTNNPKKLWLNGRYEYYNDSSLHKNMVIGETLQAIENVILFSFANYFLKFSECYKKIHNIQEMQNDWYEYVEYGTTNLLTITLQKYGFSRETALYIKQNKNNYVKIINGAIKLKTTLLEDSKDSIKNEIREVMYNAPELFID